jgi:hypothetical protein
MEVHQRSIFSTVEKLTQLDPLLVKTVDKAGAPSLQNPVPKEAKRGKRS